MTETDTKDALDVLRVWIKRYGAHYGELKPRLKIQDGIVSDVYIKRGDETTHLRKDTRLDFIEKDTIIKNEKKSHFM